MNKKNLFYVILKFFPFIIGVTLYSVGMINLVSSLFLFLGGYVTVKNLFDYRLIKKNINSIFENKNNLLNQKKVIGENTLENDNNNEEIFSYNYERVVDDELEKKEQTVNPFVDLEDTYEKGMSRRRSLSKIRNR